MRGIETNDGVRLHLTDDGTGPTVVLIAGFMAAARTWVFQVDALTAAGYRAVCLDRRSHGLSDAPAYGQRMARHGKDLHDTLTALDLDDVVLVGGSMGASTVWAYTDLFGTERVRGIVSVDQTPRMRNGDGWEHGFYGFDDTNAGTFFADGVPPTGRGFTAEQSAPAVMRLVERLGPDALTLGGIRPETMALLRDHAQQDWRDVVARAEVPVLMVAGRDSQFWPCEHAEAAVSGHPLGRAVVLEDCGHASNLDRPDAFNDALIEFLRSI
ncbi:MULTISPECIES: alpha/beta hydrolase [unclassified Pseudonocardia]|jgi:pimeloyl-ACP methyl ester carboxylesterase|uniref:alpha/beta fold hydrolase n=1 Tax=unclassified Pseudonocardia TaxID=2619320 RepID=UPI000961DA12|nr:MULTISPECIES: alpha/beta hydrolase [unclassified Pseudonocardia]MBN9102676.1 alpha/beta hydrolase [Pseudonocardia sp.]OJY37778.1 MAG: alpha/beta hydrolase [Pseudonocardia sp. 73-21]